MRDPIEYIEASDRQALERWCEEVRPELTSLVRRFRIDGFELDDLVQEGYLAAMIWAAAERIGDPLPQPHAEGAILAHLRRIKKSQERHNPPRKIMVTRKEWIDDLPDDDVRARVEDNLDALTLLIAARSECDEKDQEVLEMLVTGTGVRAMGRELRSGVNAVRVRVCRFRKRLYPKLYEEV